MAKPVEVPPVTTPVAAASPPKGVALFTVAALVYATRTRKITAGEAFASARTFMEEAERQLPGITQAMEAT